MENNPAILFYRNTVGFNRDWRIDSEFENMSDAYKAVSYKVERHPNYEYKVEPKATTP